MGCVCVYRGKSIFCVICYDSGENYTTLSCGHYFHDKCIQEWFIHSNTCPLCRTIITNTRNCVHRNCCWM